MVIAIIIRLSQAKYIYLNRTVKRLCTKEHNTRAFYDAFYPWTSCSFLHFISSFQRKWNSSEDIIRWPLTHPGSTWLGRIVTRTTHGLNYVGEVYTSRIYLWWIAWNTSAVLPSHLLSTEYLVVVAIYRIHQLTIQENTLFATVIVWEWNDNIEYFRYCVILTTSQF